MFLDAFVPRDGQTGLDIATPTGRDGINLAIKNGAISRPPPTAESFKVNERDRAWVDAKMTPQPIGVSLQKIRLTGALERVGKKAYVRAANYPSLSFDGFFAAAKTTPGWRDVRRAERPRCDGRYARTTRGTAARARVSAIRRTCGPEGAQSNSACTRRRQRERGEPLVMRSR